MSKSSKSAAEELAPELAFIDFELDSEWKKCIYSDCSRAGPQLARNNSSTALEGEFESVPVPEPEFLHRCKKDLRQRFEATSLRRDAHSITLRLCVRKHNYENYLWQFVRLGRFHGSEAYANLTLWTVQLRVRMHRRVPFGYLLRGLRSRLGLGSTTEALKLCLDGFYGMPGFGDIFGNHGDDAVPWMEISNQSTADSLQLQDGDLIFVSYSNEKLESLARARKRAIMSQPPGAPGGLGRARALNASSGSESQSTSTLREKLAKPISQNALPLEELEPPPPLHKAKRLPAPPQPQRASSPATHPGQPMCISSAATSADVQFCEAEVNTSKTQLDESIAEAGSALETFAPDGSGLLPDALEKLHRAHSEVGDLVRVRYPGSKGLAELSLVLTPELLTWMLDAANVRRTQLVHPLQAEIRAKVFKCSSASDVDAADGIGVGVGSVIGVFEELQKFASELDNRLRVRCMSAGSTNDSWCPESASYFVADTFLASSICSIYGIERNHRFQPYAVDTALRSIEESLAVFLSDPAAYPGKALKAKLERAWDNIYSLHPTPQELAAAEPCRHLKELLDRCCGNIQQPWKAFIGPSISCLYNDYSAKNAAFWAINFLVSHTAAYERLLAEIDALAGPHEFKKLVLKELEEMPFLDAFVKEVYRHTCGQFVCFRAVSDLLLQTQPDSEGVCVRSGEEAGVLLRALNMDPALFSNPEMFQPQRFLSGSQSAHLLALPFGCMWPRRRLGLLKLKLFLVILLSRFRIRADEFASASIDGSAFCADVLPWTDDIFFQFQAREQARAAFVLT